MKQLFLPFCQKLSQLMKPARPASNVENGVLAQDERAFFAARDRRAVGRWAEDLSVKFLQSRGLQILERNVRERFSELDIIAKEGNELVFAEVRCRRKSSVMRAAETIASQKWQRISRGAEIYTQKKEWTGSWRIDLVSIDVDNEKWHLTWLKYLEMGDHL